MAPTMIKINLRDVKSAVSGVKVTRFDLIPKAPKFREQRSNEVRNL